MCGNWIFFSSSNGKEVTKKIKIKKETLRQQTKKMYSFNVDSKKQNTFMYFYYLFHKNLIKFFRILHNANQA